MKSWRTLTLHPSLKGELAGSIILFSFFKALIWAFLKEPWLLAEIGQLKLIVLLKLLASTQKDVIEFGNFLKILSYTVCNHFIIKIMTISDFIFTPVPTPRTTVSNPRYVIVLDGIPHIVVYILFLLLFLFSVFGLLFILLNGLAKLVHRVKCFQRKRLNKFLLRELFLLFFFLDKNFLFSSVFGKFLIDPSFCYRF